jgi:hypothetical protein
MRLTENYHFEHRAMSGMEKTGGGTCGVFFVSSVCYQSLFNLVHSIFLLQLLSHSYLKSTSKTVTILLNHNSIFNLLYIYTFKTYDLLGPFLPFLDLNCHLRRTWTLRFYRRGKAGVFGSIVLARIGAAGWWGCEVL